MSNEDHDPFQPHAHEPNPAPPSADATFYVLMPNGEKRPFSPTTLQQLPYTTISDCYIVSTGHGTSGPFTFSGVSLKDFVDSLDVPTWAELEVVSADGFGNRVYREEVENEEGKRPLLLAYTINNQLMTRNQGLVRLIVPSEKDDALRQVKWIGEIKIIE